MVNAYFLDSSALVKRYVTEIGSTWVQNITSLSSENPLIIARITWVELFSAFARLQRENKLSSTDVAAIIGNFRYDFKQQYQVVEIDRNLTEEAGRLTQRHFLRAYDSVQLAAALKLQPASKNVNFTFVSADKRLLAAAQAEGLLIENPNNYP